MSKVPHSRAPEHVARPRLTDRLATEHVNAIEAGGGAGKTWLALDLAVALGMTMVTVSLDPDRPSATNAVDALFLALRSAGVAGASHLVELRALSNERLMDAVLEVLANRSEPLLVVIDDLHHGDAEAISLMLRLLRGLPPPHRALLLTRHVPRTAAWSFNGGAMGRVGSGDLAFVDLEVHALLSRIGLETSLADAAALRHATGGWAAAVAISARRIAAADNPGDELRRLTSGPITVQALINISLSGLSAPDREAAIQLAHLPNISALMLSSLSLPEGILERLLDAGIPLVPAGDGSVRLIDPARDVMRQAAPLNAKVAVAAADVLNQEADPLGAYRLLSASGQVSCGLALLESLSDQALRRFDFNELSAVVDGLAPGLGEAAPRVLLAYALACEQSGHKLRKEHVLAQVERRVRGTGSPLEREVDAEKAATLIREDRTEEAALLANKVLAQCRWDEHATRIRLLEVLARVAAASFSPESLAAAEANFREAIRLSIEAGHPDWAARSAVPLAGRVYWQQGRHHVAIRCLDEALEALPSRGRQRGFMLTFRAELLVDCGEYDEARGSLAEAHELGRALHDDRTIAYAAWVEARQASQMGHAAQVLERLAAVEQSRGDWYDQHFTGMAFCADAATLLDRVGDGIGARTYLRRAQERRAGGERTVAMAEAALEARGGDTKAACDLLDALLADPGPPLERWWLLLFRAYAGHRLGAPDAGWIAAAAFDAAGLMGAPTLPIIRERAVAEELLLTAIDHGSAVAAKLTLPSLPTRITVLGGLSVRRGGRDITPPPGRTAQLVKLLAVNGGRASLDLIAQTMWPDDEEGAGRTRVRNVLSRLHHSCPDLVMRHGEALAFAESVTVDVERFHTDAGRAVALAQRGDAAASAAARGVLSRYRGPVLPEDLGQEWAEVSRQAALRRVLSILDVLMAAAEREGDIHEAAALAERAAVADPATEERWIRAARLQAACGRPARGRELVGRARRVAAELGVRPSPSLVALEAELAN